MDLSRKTARGRPSRVQNLVRMCTYAECHRPSPSLQLTLFSRVLFPAYVLARPPSFMYKRECVRAVCLFVCVVKFVACVSVFVFVFMFVVCVGVGVRARVRVVIVSVYVHVFMLSTTECLCKKKCDCQMWSCLLKNE